MASSRLVRNKTLRDYDHLFLLIQFQKLNFKLMSLFEFHYVGGLSWMSTLSLLLIIIIGLSIYVFAGNQERYAKWNEWIKQVGGFALAFGAFSTLVAFFQAFGDLAATPVEIPFQVIMGGLKVALITVLYGFGIFLFSQVCSFVLKLKYK
jgi:hypothetical protein